MKLISKKPLTISEAKFYVAESEEKRPIDEYFKKFAKLDKDKAEKMREEIIALNNVKIKEEDIVKVVDNMPSDAEEVNKIFIEVSLTEDEINSLLAIVKKY